LGAIKELLRERLGIRAISLPSVYWRTPLENLGVAVIESIAGWSLRRPTERTQQLPDMAGVVADSKLALDQIGHSRACPLWRFISDLCGAFEQQQLQPFAVLQVQPRLASGLMCFLQSRSSLKTKLTNPASHGLGRNPEPASDGGLCLALLPQANGPNTAIFQLVKIAVNPRTIIHASLDVGDRTESHSNMRDCAPY